MTSAATNFLDTNVLIYAYGDDGRADVAQSLLSEPFDEKITLSALGLAERYGLSFYDAAMMAAALRAGCERYYSEDLHHSLLVEGSMAVVNPFRTTV